MADDGAKQSAGGRFSREDRDLIRRIGSNLRRIINNEAILDMVPRQDELGILANLVNRVNKELKAAHQKEAEKQIALERKVVELSEAQERQEQLMYTIREISTPILQIHNGILLLPIIGAMDSLRAMTMINKLLERVAADQAQVVILDITGMPVVDTQVANVLLQAAQSAALLGAKVVLCGMTPDVAQVVVNLGINFEGLSPTSDLQDALKMAFAINGYRISKHT